MVAEDVEDSSGSEEDDEEAVPDGCQVHTLHVYKERREVLGIQLEENGRRVRRVIAGSAASKAGICAGDELLTIGGAAVPTAPKAFKALLSQVEVMSAQTADRVAYPGFSTNWIDIACKVARASSMPHPPSAVKAAVEDARRVMVDGWELVVSVIATECGLERSQVTGAVSFELWSSVLATLHEKAWVLGHADDSATNVFRVPSPIETYVSSIPSLGKCEQQQALSQLYSLLKDDDSDGDSADAAEEDLKWKRHVRRKQPKLTCKLVEDCASGVAAFSGRAVYAKLCRLPLSTKPNCRIVISGVDGMEAALIAMKDIAVGEMLTIAGSAATMSN